MPCRISTGLHEWLNEVPTVPSQDLVKLLFWCTSQRLPVGSEDPVELYCSLLLGLGHGYAV